MQTKDTQLILEDIKQKLILIEIALLEQTINNLKYIKENKIWIKQYQTQMN